jgi:potassium/hydrogen antiporter
VFLIENILLGAAILLLLSIIASKASGRLGIPALLLFLFVGMLAGSEGPGGIYFDDPWISQLVGVAALAFILFDGGLSTEWHIIRPVFSKGLALSTLGVLVTAISVGLFATLVLGFSILEGLLLGSIVSSTDAAAVFSILRSRDVQLKGQLEPLLELESGSNDPMAVFLTIGITQAILNPNDSLLALIPMFVQQMLLGALLGFGFGRLAAALVNRMNLAYQGLYPVLTIALVLLTYGATTSLGGNGFLAVYLAGLVMRKNDFLHRRSITRFHEGLAWLMQISMFLVLGLLVFPSELLPVISIGLLISVFLILVARPLSIFLSLLPTKLNIREKTLISWVGLRGAAPIILATFPLVAGINRSDTIFNLVFFIVLTSVLLQGTTIIPVARLLGVYGPAEPRRPLYPLEFIPAASPDSGLVNMEIPARSGVVGKKIIDLRLPETALVVLVNKKDKFVIPSGGTILEAGDRMMVLADQESIEVVRSIFSSSEPPTPVEQNIEDGNHSTLLEEKEDANTS